jgi:hypothetical protein
MLLQWFPQLEQAPRVESVLGVACFVIIVVETLEVEVNRSHYKFRTT